MLDLLAYATADLAVRVVPAAAARGLARTLGRLAYDLRVPARKRLEENLARFDSDTGVTAHSGTMIPATTEGGTLARRAFEEFALSLVDFMRLDRMRPEDLPATVDVQGREHLERARASGRGVLLISAHLGNWEWGAAYLASLGVPLRLVARPHPSPAVEAFFARRRARWGVSRLSGAPVWVEASRALRQGSWVALMGDRLIEGGPRRGSACAWAAALARRTGAIILPAVSIRSASGRYLACFEPPLAPDACAAGGLGPALKRHLALHRAQWFAFEPAPEGLA